MYQTAIAVVVVYGFFNARHRVLPGLDFRSGFLNAPDVQSGREEALPNIGGEVIPQECYRHILGPVASRNWPLVH